MEASYTAARMSPAAAAPGPLPIFFVVVVLVLTGTFGCSPINFWTKERSINGVRNLQAGSDGARVSLRVIKATASLQARPGRKVGVCS